MTLVIGIITFTVIVYALVLKSLPAIVKQITCILTKRTNEEAKKLAEKQKLVDQKKLINALDEFAKYAKLERKINKLNDELKQFGSQRKDYAFKINVCIKGLVHVLQVITFLGFILRYRQEALLMMPVEWFWPLNQMISFPTSIPGAVSVTFWLLVSRTVVNRALTCLNV